MPYRFFFSYARETYLASNFAGRNPLDEFFDDLCRQVSFNMSEPIEAVAYRDTDRLRISDNWGDQLIRGMQESAVLVCIISPHYLRSLACGREVELFRQRFELLNGQPGGDRPRIIPVFWANHLWCHERMQPHVQKFFEEIQFTEKDLPPDYPKLGVHYFYSQQAEQSGSCFKFRECLANRICELSELPALPKLPDRTDFNGLPSFFERRESTGCERVAAGPLGTNVFYAVATRAEMAVRNREAAVAYEEKRESWRPFADKQNRPVGLVTRTALSDAGQSDIEYCTLGLPNDLVKKIKEARQKNSPVLIVLDRTSLELDALRKCLTSYDERDFPHAGLVTAGGRHDDDSLLDQVFPTKYGCNRPNHLWTVPPSSESYERSVAEVVTALRNVLQKVSNATIRLPQTSIPNLTNVHSGSQSGSQ